jgi:hypothetical protein
MLYQCRRARLLHGLGALLLVLALLLPTAPPAAAQSAITLDVLAGYGGSYRVSEWYPVTVVISNDGPDVQGVLEWDYPGNSQPLVFERAVDLPRGARKRLTFYALSNDFMRNAEVRLLVDGNLRHREQIRLSPIEAERMVVGVLSSDSALLNSLNAVTPVNASGTTVVRMEPDLLPDNAMALTGIDALFVHDIATAELSQAQRSALELWVRLGGSLVVSGGVTAERTVPGLRDLLPVTVGELEPDIPLSVLARLPWAPADAPALDQTTTINRVQLRPDAEALDSSNLLTTHGIGAGQVIFSAFDIEVLRTWTSEADLWVNALDEVPSVALASAFRWQNRNMLPNVLELPELQLPSFWVILLFILGYIVAVGPLNFFILRRIRRIDLAWLTIPATVIVFVIATYSTSFMLRGFTPQVLQVAVVQGFEGSPHSKATSFMGIFSPRRGVYTVDFESEALVSTGRFDMNRFDEAPLRWTDGGTRLRDALVDVSSLRSFVVEQSLENPVQVQSNLDHGAQRIAGTVQNTSALPLQDALLIADDSVQQLGTLEPGDTREIALELGLQDFSAWQDPAEEDQDETGMFNRYTMMEVVVDVSRTGGNNFGMPGPGAPGGLPHALFQPGHAYLIGWREAPVVEAQLVDTAAEQHGLTLYIVQLAGEQVSQ